MIETRCKNRLVKTATQKNERKKKRIVFMRVSSPPAVLTFDEVQRFPVAVHPDPKCHNVDKYTAAPGHTSHEEHSTGLHIAQFLNSPAATRHEFLAFRELLQNMFDELIRANGGTYNGIEVVEGVRRQKEVICFYNPGRQVRLAEIIINDKTTTKKEHFYYGHQKPAGELPCEAGEYGTLTFVNYGTVIPKMGQLLTMGYSTKHGVANQVGMYGEGLKTAVLRLLRCGAGVEIYCCTDEWTVRPVTQRLRFFVSTDKTKTVFGTLGDARTSIEPYELTEGSKDKVRFQVQVIYPKKSYESAVYTAETVEAKPKNFGFKIRDYMLNSELIRNRTGPNDHGFVVQQQKQQQQQGRIYACNFHVFDDANWIAFSYNLFTTVGRDRNTVNQNVLRQSIMEIWNAIFQNPRETALQHRFFEKMRAALESGNDNHWLEFQCLDDLGEKAREVITGIFRSKNPSVQAVLLERDIFTAELLLEMSASNTFIKTLHPILYDILTSQHGQRFLKFEDWVKNEQTKLRNDTLVAEEDTVPTSIKSLMTGQNAVFKSGKTSRAKWATEEGNRVLINWSILSTSSPTTDIMLNKLICKWLPAALGPHFDIVPLIKRTVLRVSLKNATTTTTTNNKDDDTEPGPASVTRKRSAEEAAVCPYPPIEGTKWQHGWFLLPQ